MGGLGTAFVLFVVLAGVGVVSQDEGQVVLIFVQSFALFVAGYVAGRFTSGAPLLDGGLAGLLVLMVSVAISVAAGAALDPLQTLLLGVVAAILGSAGGVLGQMQRS